MAHLILIKPDHTLSFQILEQPPRQVIRDIRTYGRLPDYINHDAFTRNRVVKYTVSTWSEWVVVLPVEEENRVTSREGQSIRITRRQLDVLYCLSKGMTGKQIAGMLNINTRSVSLHISALKQNLDANTAAECVQKAARLGILKPGN